MAYTTIKKPSDYFNTLLYTATGTQSVTGAGFQPDMSWVKARSTTSSHYIADAVRGSTKTISTNNTNAEGTQNLITSFDSDGVSLGSSNWSDSRTAVIWNWLGANGTAANTDGSISSTVSANTTSGFSIVSYTGTGSNATVGHGLGVVPKMIIVKKRSATGSWNVYHSSLGNTKAIQLDLTSIPDTNSVYWNNTSPTSSVLSLGTSAQVNGSSVTYIAYCFAEKQGYSKFGSYKGNGNADGTFVYTGFKPAFVLVKNTQQGGDNWFMWDNKRPGYNQTQKYLSPNSSNAEADSSSYAIDTLSNGFKVRASTGAINNNNETMIYMAFAEEPLVGDNPATAR